MIFFCATVYTLWERAWSCPSLYPVHMWMNKLSSTSLVSQNFAFVISFPNAATRPDTPHSERHNDYQLEELLINQAGWGLIPPPIPPSPPPREATVRNLSARTLPLSLPLGSLMTPGKSFQFPEFPFPIKDRWSLSSKVQGFVTYYDLLFAFPSPPNLPTPDLLFIQSPKSKEKEKQGRR